jgi:hypothetical protein
MTKNRPKKQCSKAKREKEILEDITKLDRVIKSEIAAAEKARDGGIASVHTKMALTLGNRKKVLEQELHDLWTLPGPKKQRARQRDGLS